MPHRVRRHAVEQPLDKSIRYIPLTRGHIAIVDAEDYEHLVQWNWSTKGRNPKRYIASRNREYVKGGQKGAIDMHRYLMGVSGVKRVQVDHINGNSLDNRRSNLRLVNNQQNSCNKGLTIDNTTGYAGVSKYKLNPEWWTATIAYRGKQTLLGIFTRKELAHEVYKDASLRLMGEFSPFFSGRQ